MLRLRSEKKKKESQISGVYWLKIKPYDRISRNFAIGHPFSNLSIKELFLAKVFDIN